MISRIIVSAGYAHLSYSLSTDNYTVEIETKMTQSKNKQLTNKHLVYKYIYRKQMIESIIKTVPQ